MSDRRLLAEMFGVGGIVGTPAINRINEDEDDDAFERAGWGGKSDPYAHTNSQLSGAKSVAGGGGPKTRVGASGLVQRRQGELDSAKSIFDEAAGGGGLQISGDKETLGALMDSLQEAEHAASDPDLASWCRSSWKAIAAGIRGDGNVTLPKFQKADDDLMPDEEPEEGGF